MAATQATARLEEVRRKYVQEAEKRLQGSERLPQFQPGTLTAAEEARLQSILEDPWVDHAALNTQNPAPIANGSVHKFLIVGAGLGGVVAAAQFINAGIAAPEDIRLVDSAGGFGGTWYWHRYPGLHCDIESYCYLPLLEETGYVPSRKYVSGEEIRLQVERVARLWKFADKALFRTDVKSAEWDEGRDLWTVKATERRGPGPNAPTVDLTFHAHHVYLASGVLTKPQVPAIPGIISFGGSLFHTSRWNYSVSGGNPQNWELEKLRDKRIAVVGTAATGVGVIPEVAKYAKELYVVQRTPAYVKARGQKLTDPVEFQEKVANRKGWQFERQLNFNLFITNSAPAGTENLVGDEWTNMPAYSAITGSPRHGVVDPSPENLRRLEDEFHALDLPHMESVRARVDREVRDPAVAEKLKPWYPSWCKRPTFSDTYLASFNQPNVHLLDTDGQNPERVTEDAIVVGGKAYPVDVIVFSTGYRVAAVGGSGSPAEKSGLTIRGRDGLDLDDKWTRQGATTLHGYATAGFPNLYFTGTSQATITGNNVMMLTFIAKHIAHWIASASARLRAQSGSSNSSARPVIEVTREAEEAHTAEVVQRAPFYHNLATCTPGYFNGHGAARRTTDPAARARGARAAIWSEGTHGFLRYIYAWEREGRLRGLEVRAALGEEGRVGARL